MLFKCPVCHEKHSVPDNYDHKDYICPNTSDYGQKVFNNVVPTDILSKNNLLNKRSTKVDEARAVTVFDVVPTYKPDGEKIGTLKNKNY